jgi:succinoglycan biosynthesis transport protein ExoP
MGDELTVLPRPARVPSPTPRDLLAIFFRQRRLVLVSFFLVFLAVTLYGLLFPSYQSHMKILVRRGRVDPSTTPMVPEAAPLDRGQISEEDLNSEVELLRDQEILRTVVNNSGLISRKSLWPASDAQREERATRSLARQMDARPLRKTSLIEVAYSAADPAQASNVLRSLAHAYLQRHVRVHQPSGEFDFFEQQVTRAQRGLEQAQTELVNFTSAEGVVSASLERDNALQRLNESENGYRQVEIQISETAERFRTLQSQLLTLPERMLRQQRNADNPELLEKLKSRLLELHLKRTELLTKFEPTYRLVTEVDTQIAVAKEALANEQQFPLRDETTDQNPDYEWAKADLLKTKVELSSLHSRASATGRVVEKYRQVADQLGKRALQQDALLRNLKTAESNYLLYANKREEARIGDALDQNGILNVSIAEQPSVPALPMRSAVTFGVLGIFMGGLFSTTAAFVVDRIDPFFRNPDEVAAYLAIPVLASLPQRIN